MSKVELHFGAATDVGRVRDHNEDAYLAEPPVFVVADGMGGHHGGEVASAIVVEEFARMADSGYDRPRGAEAVADDDELGSILAEAQDPRDAADRIVAAAVAAGGTDNATAVVIDVVGLTMSGGSYDAAQQRLSLQQKLGSLPRPGEST